MLPGQEALAFGHAFGGNYIKAARTLDRWLKTGRKEFGEDGPAYVDQRRRYAPIMAQAEFRRTKAIEMMKEADALMARVEVEERRPFEDLVVQQLTERAQKWLPASDHKGISDQEVGAELKRLRWMLMISDFTPRPWKRSDLATAALAIIVPATVFMSVVVAMLGGDDVSGAQSLGVMVVCFLTLLGLASAFGARVHGRLWGREWRRPLFDDVEERFENERQRELAVELASQAWDQGFVSKDALSDKIKSLSGRKFLRRAERSLVLEIELLLTGSLDRIQEIWRELESAPVANRERRIRALQVAARNAWRFKHGRDTSRAIMREVILLQR